MKRPHAALPLPSRPYYMMSKPCCMKLLLRVLLVLLLPSASSTCYAPLLAEWHEQ